MKALQLIRPREFAPVEIPEPGLPGPGWVKVRLARAMVCGSDIPSFDATRLGTIYPLAPGKFIHECSGWVVESSSPMFKPGDRVVAMPQDMAGLAEIFPAEEDKTVLVPAEIDDLGLAVLIQPLATIVFALDKLGDVTGLSATVIGAGTIGLQTAWLLKHRGAGPIRVVEPLPNRLELARGLGAEETAALTSTELTVMINSRGLDWPLSDIVVDAAGHEQAILNAAIGLVKPGGRILALGLPLDPVYAIEYRRLFFANIQLVTSVTPPTWRTHMDRAVRLVADHQEAWRPLITHHLPVSQAQAAFELFRRRRDGVVRVVLEADPWR